MTGTTMTTTGPIELDGLTLDDVRAGALRGRLVTVLGLARSGLALTRFLAEQNYRGPVLIVSGFDRRVLESAFRLGEALGLNMVGPVEKPVRLDVLEELLSKLKATLVQ